MCMCVCAWPLNLFFFRILTSVLACYNTRVWSFQQSFQTQSFCLKGLMRTELRLKYRLVGCRFSLSEFFFTRKEYIHMSLTLTLSP